MQGIDAEFQELREIQKQLKETMDFDLFSDPLFVECLVCKLCLLKKMHKENKWDAETKGGIRIEIKYSNLVKCKGLNPRRYFIWWNLQGCTKKGDKADIFIFVGRNSPSEDNPLMFFVLPKEAIGTRTHMTHSILKRKYNGSNKWSEYRCSMKDLRETVEKWEQRLIKIKGEEND